MADQKTEVEKVEEVNDPGLKPGACGETRRPALTSGRN